MGLAHAIIEEITNNLDKRRLEITKLRRILLNYINKPLEPIAVRIAIPLLYANWEGYVKEVCQLYLEFIEASEIYTKELRPALVGYLWTSALKPLTGGLNFEKKKAVAEVILNGMENPVRFADSERIINTKSNLNFDVLIDIATHLCLEINTFIPWKHHLDALVNLRNNIAHGANPNKLTYDIFEKYASSVMGLMEEFEIILMNALDSRNFCRV